MLNHLNSIYDSPFFQTIIAPAKLALKVTNERRVSLIFFDNQKTFINRGTMKKVLKAYELGSQKVIAYAKTEVDVKNVKCLKIVENEERFLRHLQGGSSIIDVYRISYYRPSMDTIEQVIEVE